MSPGLRNTLVVAALVVGPLLLGLVLVGAPPPTGRSSRSATRVGHKAFALLLTELGYDVRPFARGVEVPPEEPGVFLALEPGPALLRGGGRYARGLFEWVGKGNAAIITLGPDPDRDAEIDDRPQLFGEAAGRALELAERARAQAQARAEQRRAARASEEGAPEPELLGVVSAADPDESWPAEALLDLLALPYLEVRGTGSSTRALAGPLADRTGREHARLALTRPRLLRPRAGRPAGGRIEGLPLGPPLPLLTTDAGDVLAAEVRLGAGRVIVLAEPRLVHNGNLARGGHAQLGVRLVERLSRAGQPLYLEEWSHGERAYDDPLSLVLGTRARWPMGQVLLAAAVAALALALPRRSPVPFEQPPRRSRQELILAMASLFARGGDLAGAGRALEERSRARLRRALGLADDARLEGELAARLGRSEAELTRLLTPAPLRSNQELVARARALALLRREVERDG